MLGHISLLGYSGRIIAPMTTGGPDESALGDPVEILLTEWARQCQQQGGLVVLPHFPNPRAEHAASIVSGDVDAVEMTSWGNLYGGIDPYSLSDWYRYLNCGYLVAGGGRHRQDDGRHGGGHGAHLRAHRRQGSRSPTRPGWRPCAAARPSSPTARCSSSPWMASRWAAASRMTAQRRHGRCDLAGGQRHRAR